MSDCGSCFTSEEFKSILSDNNIEQSLIATASHKANGQVERVNRVLGSMLAKLSDPTTNKHWYKILPEAEFALNNTTQKSTGETPSKLLFGVNQHGKAIDVLGEV